MSKKVLNGKVVGDQNDKTIVVLVKRRYTHSFYGKVIPIFEFYNTITKDYAYSTNFEWHLNQSPGTGFMFQKVYSGYMKKPQQVVFNEIGMKFKYLSKGLFKVPDKNTLCVEKLALSMLCNRACRYRTLETIKIMRQCHSIIV